MSEQARPLVVDASAVLDFLLQLISAPHIGRLITQPLVRLHAPDTLDREVVSVLRRQERAGDLKPADADDVLRDFASLSVELPPSRPYLDGCGGYARSSMSGTLTTLRWPRRWKQRC